MIYLLGRGKAPLFDTHLIDFSFYRRLGPQKFTPDYSSVARYIIF